VRGYLHARAFARRVIDMTNPERPTMPPGKDDHAADDFARRLRDEEDHNPASSNMLRARALRWALAGRPTNEL